jgi:hypothetical protein
VLDEERLLGWYAEDLPRRGGLRSVPIPWTFRRYREWCEARGVRADADLFHRVLEGMAERGRIALTDHDLPASVAVDEASLLRTTREGRLVYYWMALA